MKFLGIIAGSLLASAAILPVSQAATLDFNAFGDGTVMNTQYAGVTISAINNGGGPNLAVTYNSEGGIGRDDDLEENHEATKFTNGNTGQNGVTGFGNLLIVQENSTGCGSGTCTNPDDEAGGGILGFSFATQQLFKGFDYFDIDDSPDPQNEDLTVTLFSNADFTGSLLTLNMLGTGGDNTFGNYVFANPFAVRSITFDFVSSGAIDNILISSVPIPAALPMFLVGLAGLGIMTRRRKTAA